MSRFKKILPNLLIILGVTFLLLAYGPVFYDEFWYRLKEFKHQRYGLDQEGIPDSPFARLLSTKPINITPVNEDFAIVIEKIGVNAPIVKDVTITNEDEYLASLKEGVAHASTSPYPSDKPGNVYLFAHSSANFWELGKYAKVFNLARKLDIGDRIHIFYEGEMFVYEVVNTEVHKGWNTYPLTRKVIEPTLTLQTCDPPGTTINRLVVTAKLVESPEAEF